MPSPLDQYNYTEWMQPDDVEVGTLNRAFWETDLEGNYVQSLFTVPYGIEDTASIKSGDPIPMDADHIRGYWTSVGSVASQTIGSEGEGSNTVVFDAAHTNGRRIPSEDDPSEYFDSHFIERGLLGKLFHLNPSSLLWKDDWIGDIEWPEGATGFEVEPRSYQGTPQPAARIQAVSVRFQGEARMFGGDMGPLQIAAAISSRWLTQGEAHLSWTYEPEYGMMTHAMPFADESIEPVDKTVNFMAMDYPELLESEPVGPDLVAPISTWMSIRVPPGTSDFFGSHTDGYTSGSTTAVWADDEQVVNYILRPPRIRFYFPPVMTAKGLQGRTRFSEPW